MIDQDECGENNRPGSVAKPARHFGHTMQI